INLGNSHPETTRRLIEVIEQSVGRQAIIECRPPHPADAENTYADISKAQHLLGYQPSTRLEQGIAQYVTWLRSASAEV
ncbi:MAG: epimerase, partial [Candidatus Chloroheliales bacterium]